MIENSRLKPTFWRIFFFMISLAYLVPEAIFNAKLVSLIGLGTPGESELEHLEIFGRAISGVGVTLLIADLLPARFYKSVTRGLLALLLLLGLIWPTVFFGQKWLVEQFLIKPSSAEQREYAVLSAILRDALALNAIKVTGIEYDSAEMHQPENLTFLALFGGLLYADDKLAEKLIPYQEKIIRRFVAMRAYQKLDDYYAQFSRMYEELSKAYREYAKASNQYNDTLNDMPRREQKYWQVVEDHVHDGWNKYQQAQKVYLARAEARAQKFGPKIYQYFEGLARCRKTYSGASQFARTNRARCLERKQARYKSEIVKAGLGYIEPDYWLIVEDVSALENAANTILGGVLTGGVSTALQLLDAATGGDGGIKDKRYKYTNNPEHYRLRFLAHPKFQAQFQKETGYPMNIDGLKAFRAHPVTQRKLREALKGKGVILPETWRIEERQAFSQAVVKAVKREADMRWQSEMRRRGLSLPPNLEWIEFQRHRSVQKKIAEKMGAMYVTGARADWNKRNFVKHVLEPNIARETKKYLAMISGARPLFADGGRYEQVGKQALRSVVIPPISMSLSLFLICMTLIKLPLKALEVFQPQWKRNTHRGVVWGIKIVPLICVLALPVIFVHNQYTGDSQSPVNFFLQKVDETSSPLFSFMLKWTLHTQPLLQPLGGRLEQHTGLYRSAGALTHRLAEVDKRVFDEVGVDS